MKLTRRGFLSAAAVLPLVPTLLPEAVKVTVCAGPGIAFPVDRSVFDALDLSGFRGLVLDEGLTIEELGANERLVAWDPPAPRPVSLFKGRSVGPTTGAIEGLKWIDNSVPTRGDYERVIGELNEMLRKPMPRPDLVVIDGVGYGPSDPLPPPFGRGEA